MSNVTCRICKKIISYSGISKHIKNKHSQVYKVKHDMDCPLCNKPQTHKNIARHLKKCPMNIKNLTLKQFRSHSQGKSQKTHPQINSLQQSYISMKPCRVIETNLKSERQIKADMQRKVELQQQKDRYTCSICLYELPIHKDDNIQQRHKYNKNVRDAQFIVQRCSKCRGGFHAKCIDQVRLNSDNKCPICRYSNCIYMMMYPPLKK